MSEMCAKSISLKENFFSLQVFLCALISRPVCVRTRENLIGKISASYKLSF